MPIDTIQEQFRQQTGNVATILKNHPALMFSSLYVLLTANGLFYSVLFYKKFGFSFIDFAQPADFLMASIKEPLLLALNVGSILFIVAVYRLDLWMRRRYAWYEALYRPKSLERFVYHPLVLLAMLILYAATLTYNYVELTTARAMAGKHPEVVIELRTRDGLQSIRRTHLGTTSSFILVYDIRTKESRAISIDSIESIVVSGAKETQVE
jgi:magnesium-transporting ATPase (P-type)